MLEEQHGWRKSFGNIEKRVTLLYATCSCSEYACRPLFSKLRTCASLSTGTQ